MIVWQYMKALETWGGGLEREKKSWEVPSLHLNSQTQGDLNNMWAAHPNRHQAWLCELSVVLVSDNEPSHAEGEGSWGIR